MRRSTKWKGANIRGREPTSRWLTASGLNRQGRYYSLLTTRGSNITECLSFHRHPIASCRARKTCTGSPEEQRRRKQAGKQAAETRSGREQRSPEHSAAGPVRRRGCRACSEAAGIHTTRTLPSASRSGDVWPASGYGRVCVNSTCSSSLSRASAQGSSKFSWSAVASPSSTGVPLV
jgi:hypothetical protein